MAKLKKYLVCGAILLLASCSKGYISVRKEWVDSTYLASSHVGTPDPRQENPPLGERLVLSWWVPQRILEKNPQLVVNAIYWNFTQRTFSYPINSFTGFKICPLIGEEYKNTQGFLAYRVQIVTEDNEVFKDWKHQLWVKLIDLDEKLPPIEKTPDEPVQGEEEPMPTLDTFDDDLYAEYEPALEEFPELIADSAESMSSSVDDQSRQGSVIETPFLSDSSSSESD